VKVTVQVQVEQAPFENLATKSLVLLTSSNAKFSPFSSCLNLTAVLGVLFNVELDDFNDGVDSAELE
jgi:hypothetical protein